MGKRLPPIVDVGGVLISSDILTERFCCDLDTCRGACCVEGNAGAPVTLEEVADIERVLDEVWPDMAASAQALVDRQGLAYTDQEGDLVTSIVGGKDCVFTCLAPVSSSADGESVTLCLLEKAYREGRCDFCKPISCALYPIREKRLGKGLVGLNYHKWDICACAREKGKSLNLPVYRFLKEPLVRRFGAEWYAELEMVVAELEAQGYL